ncbi:MAG: cytochrome P450 [Alphaproteobacteria bacterium]|nr:cytochrome P450 [Alphaproteobacteria bacterium]
MTEITVPPGGWFSHLFAISADPLHTIAAWAEGADGAVRIPWPVPGQRSMLITDPALIEEILVRKHKHFRKDWFTRRLSNVMGDSLVTAEGETWRRQRKLAQPAFHSRQIDGYARVMVEEAEACVAPLADGQALDLNAEMMALTLRVVCRALFGARMTEDIHGVAEAIEAYMRWYLGVGGSGVPLPDWVPSAANREKDAAIALLDDVLARLIAARRAEPADDLLSTLIAAVDEDGGGLSDRELRDEAATLMLAGHETTAQALTMGFFLLGTHPDALARLHAEVDALEGPLGLHSLAGLDYTTRVFKETMRLYPPVWGIGREALEDVTIGDLPLHRGDQIWLAQWAMHRSPRFFDDPLAFRPERWTPEMEAALPRFAYFPFGGGPRVCIGQRFAMMEGALLLAALARQARFEPQSPEPPELLPSVTIRPVGGLPVTVRRRT